MTHPFLSRPFAELPLSKTRLVENGGIGALGLLAFVATGIPVADALLYTGAFLAIGLGFDLLRLSVERHEKQR